MHARNSLLRHLAGIALFAATVVTSAAAHDIILGVGTHFINYPNVQPLMLNLAQRVGADSVRADTGWSLVETTKGRYTIPPAWDQFVNDAKKRGMEPLLILDYGNKLYDNGKIPRSPAAIQGFVRFATFVVKHFAGRVRYYEVWNEWNTGTGGYYPGGSAQDYARLFDATYAAIKRVDPATIVLASSGYKNWYTQIAKLGVAARADGVAIHPYVARESDYHPWAGSNGAERSAQKVIDDETTMRRLSGGKEIPLYITEIGWPSSTGSRGYPEQDVARMAERTLLMFAAMPYVRGVWWYDLVNDSTDETNPEARFGLFRHRSYAPKPVGDVVRSLAPLLKNNSLVWSRQSNLAAGVVALGRVGAPYPWIMAWKVQPLSKDQNSARAPYIVSCNRSLTITHALGAAPMAGQPLNSVPTAFSYQAGHCSRVPLSAQ